MADIYDRTRALIGDAGIERLKSKNVLIVGLGGVGGYAAEMLARAGVGHLTLVDGDVVDVTNLNRQIIALSSNIGAYKADEFKKRIALINADIQVRALNMRFNQETANFIFDRNYDYVLDAIDSVEDKTELICLVKCLGIPIISAMGAGNRIYPAEFRIVDIYKTSYDKLAKKMRTLLRERGIKSLDTVCCNSPASGSSGTIGSIAYMPAAAGIKMGGYVILKLLGEA